MQRRPLITLFTTAEVSKSLNSTKTSEARSRRHRSHNAKHLGAIATSYLINLLNLSIKTIIWKVCRIALSSSQSQTNSVIRKRYPS